MFIACTKGATASTLPAADLAIRSTLAARAPYPLSGGASGHSSGHSSGPRPPREPVRHLLFGTLSSVQTTITHLHSLGYAEPNDWSRPISTGRPNEVMAILTKRVGAA